MSKASVDPCQQEESNTFAAEFLLSSKQMDIYPLLGAKGYKDWVL